MNNVVKNLILEFITTFYPISKMRISKDKHYGIKTKGNFKRAIKIGGAIYRISNDDQKYVAMRVLSSVICRSFHITQDESIPILKKHLHIK
jgi:hypothetical protein